jgi:Holliday junction DNA helicase RuvA
VISSLRGTLKRILSDRVVLDVQGVGYEVFLPMFVRRSLDGKAEGDPAELVIYYHVSDRQLRPTLIGFNVDVERRFFEKIISVEDIGPLKAVKAMVFSVSTTARAIEQEDIGLLRQMPGIGERTARKMVATLRGKVTEEALLRDEGFAELPPGETPAEPTDVREEGIEILVSLGHRRSEAVTKVDAVLKRTPLIDSAEELIREVYRAERGLSAIG